jgi:hypothetical protein
MVSLEYPDIGVPFDLPEGSQSTGKEGTTLLVREHLMPLAVI